jgi:hypothetical protein
MTAAMVAPTRQGGAGKRGDAYRERGGGDKKLGRSGHL